MRLAHRGAYEHLWAEQKYSFMAVSLKSFRSGTCRFSHDPPQALAFLAQLAKIGEKPRSEILDALLHVYDHLIPHLDRPGRRFFIDRLLSGNRDILDEFYQMIISYQESFLYGCRIFFPKEAFNKFWDFEGRPELWVVLGPFLGCVKPGEIMTRLTGSAAFSEKEILGLLKNLKTGMQKEDFSSLPESLQQEFKRCCAVATPGNKVFLHPRFPAFESNSFPSDRTSEQEPDHVALRVLEEFWDSNPDRTPEFPSYEEWKTMFDSRKSSSGQASQSFEDVTAAFVKQALAESYKFKHPEFS